MINFDVFKSIEVHWIVLYVKGNSGSTSYNAIYFDSFEVELIPKEIKIN